MKEYKLTCDKCKKIEPDKWKKIRITLGEYNFRYFLLCEKCLKDFGIVNEKNEMYDVSQIKNKVFFKIIKEGVQNNKAGRDKLIWSKETRLDIAKDLKESGHLHRDDFQGLEEEELKNIINELRYFNVIEGCKSKSYEINQGHIAVLSKVICAKFSVPDIKYSKNPYIYGSLQYEAFEQAVDLIKEMNKQEG